MGSVVVSQLQVPCSILSSGYCLRGVSVHVLLMSMEVSSGYTVMDWHPFSGVFLALNPLQSWQG